MGRRKIEIKRIQDLKNRDVTFCKRRRGLMKKAEELAILCDVKVGVVVFSNRGKMFEYCSPNTSMKQIIDEYMQELPVHELGGHASSSLSLIDTCAGGLWINQQECQVHVDQMTREMANLKNEMGMLQRCVKYFMGEDLETLSMNDLHQLEQQMEATIYRIRSWKAFSTLLSSSQPLQYPFNQIAAVDNSSLEPQMLRYLFPVLPASVERSFESQMQLGNFSYEHECYRRDLPREPSPFEFQQTPHFWM